MSLSASWSCSGRAIHGDSSNESRAGVGGSGGSTSGKDGSAEPTPGGRSGANGDPGESGNPGVGGSRGGAPAQAALAIVSVSPADGAVNVEREATIEVTFNRPLDADTVTAETFRVLKNGAEVTGKLEVGRRSIKLEPAALLQLVSEYTVEVAGEIADEKGRALGEGATFTFAVRDGVFSEPQQLWSKELEDLRVVGSREGQVAAHFSDAETPSSRMVAIFNPLSRAWSDLQPAQDEFDIDYGTACVAVSGTSQATAFLSGNDTLWNRATNGNWGTAMTGSMRVTSQPWCALAANGMALQAWDEGAPLPRVVRTVALDGDGFWTGSQQMPDAEMRGVATLSSGFLFLVQQLDDGRCYAYGVGASWGPLRGPTPVTPPGHTPTHGSLAGDGASALWTWRDDDAMARASLFDGESWTTQLLGPMDAGTQASMGAVGYLASWNYKGSGYVARYDVGAGWGDPVKLGPTEDPLHAPALAIDDLGRALAIWPEGDSIAWRRQLGANGAWSERHELPEQNPILIHAVGTAEGEAVLVWQNPLGVWASRFE